MSRFLTLAVFLEAKDKKLVAKSKGGRYADYDRNCINDCKFR